MRSQYRGRMKTVIAPNAEVTVGAAGSSRVGREAIRGRWGARRLAGALALTLAAGCADSAPAPLRAVPPSYATRLELACPGKPQGIAAADWNGDGIADAVITSRGPSTLQFWAGRRGDAPGPTSLVEVGDWALAPAYDPRTRTVAVASRAADSLELFTLAAETLTAGARWSLGGTPRALAAGPTGWAVATDGELVVFAADGTARRAPLPNSRATCVRELPAGGWLVGFQVPRSVAVFDTELEVIRQWPLEGIPRHIALDGDDESGAGEVILAGGDDALWSLDAAAASAPVRVASTGRVPVFGARVGGELLSVNYSGLTWGLADGGVDGYCGQTPIGAALGDFDGDGRDDLLVANRDAARLSFVRGGAGAVPFIAPEKIRAGKNPLALVTADFDRDGRRDVLTVTAGDGEAVLLLNAPEGWKVEARIPLGPSPSSPVIGDFDGDGRLDAIIAAQFAESSRGIFLRGTAGGGLERDAAGDVELGRGVRALLAHDFDEDGRDELLVLDAASSELRHLGPAAGPGPTWSEHEQVAIPPHAVAMARSGFLLATAHAGPERGILLRGLACAGAEEFGERRLATAGDPVHVALGDLDADGRDDLFVVSLRPGTKSGWLEVFLDRDGEWLALAPQPGGVDPQRVILADRTGDGRVDPLVAARGSHQLCSWLASEDEHGAPALVRLADLGADLGPMDAAVADFDGDGGLDIVVANAFSEALSVIYSSP